MGIVEIDGSFGEGGGQILRTALALSVLSGQPVRIYNIRARRPKPGLQHQHLTSVRAIAEVSSARVEGLKLGSTEIVFYPGRVRKGIFDFDIGTAGSVTLVLQAILPVLAYAPGPVEVNIRGGTDVPWSPPIDYVRHVLRRLLEYTGFSFEVVLRRRGHYPQGGGIVTVRIDDPPRRMKSLYLRDRGAIRVIEGLSHAVKLPRHVSERQAASAYKVLESLRVPIHIETEWYEPQRDPHIGPGSGIVLWAVTEHSILGGDALGAKGKPAEEVGAEAAKNLLEDLATGKALDRHASDMLLTYAAIACGESVLGGARLTSHAMTNLHIIRTMLPGVKAELIEGGEIDKPFAIRITGVCLEGG